MWQALIREIGFTSCRLVFKKDLIPQTHRLAEGEPALEVTWSSGLQNNLCQCLGCVEGRVDGKWEALLWCLPWICLPISAWAILILHIVKKCQIFFEWRVALLKNVWGPDLILSPRKFKEHMEGQWATQSSNELKNSKPQLFLFYDIYALNFASNILNDVSELKSFPPPLPQSKQYPEVRKCFFFLWLCSCTSHICVHKQKLILFLV